MTLTEKRFDGVTVDYETPHIAVITIDTKPANTIGPEARDDLFVILDELDADERVRAVVLTGKGEIFTAGANLNEDQSLSAEAAVEYVKSFHRLFSAIESFRVPVIAAINGPTVGGGLEFALCCDIRIASRKAFFVAAGVNVGLIVNFWRLPRIVGLGPAKEILLTGGRYSAEEALRWGLVTELHDDDALLPAALSKAERIATRAPLSVEATKSSVLRSLDLDLADASALQAEQMLSLFHTEDHQEALRAFFEKRLGNYNRR